MHFDSSMAHMLLLGFWETVFMVSVSSFISYLLGIPLGLLLVVRETAFVRMRRFTAHSVWR